MDLLTAIQLSAMKAVEQPDHEACLRRVFRCYSKTFHTPLHVVETLPEEWVLSHYYEELYSDMKPEDRELELEALLETDEQRAERTAKKDSEAAAVAALVSDTALLEAIKVVGRKKAPPKSGAVPVPTGAPPTKTTLAKLQEIPEEISMIFGE